MSLERGREPAPRLAAPTGASAARIARDRRALPNGIWGMALFLTAEVALFGTLLSSYFYLDFTARRWPPAGIKPPEVVLPLVATAVLLASLVPVREAVRAAMRDNRNGAIAGIVAGLAIQCIYLAFQILLFRHDLRQFTPQGSAYGSIYFTLLVVHHAHVALGIALNLVLIWHLSRAGLTNYWLIGVRALALYWYVVGALAVVVVLTQLAPSL